jgi:biotin carboxylase
MKTVVFVETNFSGLDAIRYCKEHGYFSVLVTDSMERFKKWFPASCLHKLDLVDKVITVKNSNDFTEVLEALKKNLNKIDALLTFAEIRTKVVAQLCQELGLKGANPESIVIAQNKGLFRTVLLESGADSVQSMVLDDIEQLNQLNENKITFPFFIKPLQGHSSIGAVVCNSKSDLKSLASSLSKISEDWISRSFVVEDYLVGDLVSVEVLTYAKNQHHVVGVSDRDVVKDSIEVGSSFPLSQGRYELAKNKALMALDAIGYDFGASHVEVMLTETGAHLVEVNTRVGGSGHSIMLDLATNRSIVGDCVELALGNLHTASELYFHERGAAWKCFVSPKTGFIRELPSEEEVKSLSGVEEVWFHQEVGNKMTGINSNYNWIAQVMCVGADQLEAKQNASLAIDFISKNTLIT